MTRTEAAYFRTAPDAFSILTFNASLLDVRLLGVPVYRPLPAVDARLEALIPALRTQGADIICLQEVFHPRHKRRLRDALADLYPHVAGMAAGDLRIGSDLLVLSRFPVDEAAAIRFRRAMREESLFTDRGLLAARVEIPGIGAASLVTLHTSAGGLFHHPESPHAEAVRDAQIAQLLDLATCDGPVILAGDFNAGPEVSAAHYDRVVEAGFVDAFAAVAESGATWDPANPLVAGGGERHLPAQRIDHVFYDLEVATRMRPDAGDIVLNRHRVRHRGRELPLSDHYGVMVRFAPV